MELAGALLKTLLKIQEFSQFTQGQAMAKRGEGSMAGAELELELKPPWLPHTCPPFLLSH